MAPTHPAAKTTTTTHKTLLTTPNPFEQRFGYHRAVRRGPLICVSGTTAVKVFAAGPDAELDVDVDAYIDAKGERRLSEVQILHPGDAHKQAKTAMSVAVEAVRGLGGELEDVVRVRMFVANHEDCDKVGAAFKDIFGQSDWSEGDSGGSGDVEDTIGAAATMIVVPGGFVDKDMLVEIEVDAYVL
ncbi:hypothetical protein LTR70_003528 [Exophiala xenobiotica]|uniref:YjgF-like protein n=1 Tax=Lithohypha guttulata TaxID=1690604 RepID=A0ABR0KFT6_9EURO|nr:hypothetical protein LTR24_003076 [Lithohypha guttulata]KAK5322907.1 hypothetical protein LTR70_003528 [Exophiala xenobiotica]